MNEIEARALDCIEDSEFEYTDAEKIHMQSACVRFARCELAREFRTMRDLDMGAAVDHMLERLDELEADGC